MYISIIVMAYNGVFLLHTWIFNVMLWGYAILFECNRLLITVITIINSY